MERCYIPTNAAYKNYGARGIDVCVKWVEDPTSFVKWYKERYFDSGQVDRIDVNKGYSPDNCRIVTAKDNSRNKRNTVFLEAWNEKKPISEWAEDKRAGKGVVRDVVYNRIQYGWNPEDCISVDVSEIPGQSSFAPMITAFGESKTLHEWFIDPRCRVSKKLLWSRIDAGWYAEKAITTEPAKNAGRRYEGKSVLQWSKDPRCEVSYKVLNTRLKKDIPLDTALKSQYDTINTEV